MNEQFDHSKLEQKNKGQLSTLLMRSVLNNLILIGLSLLLVMTILSIGIPFFNRLIEKASPWYEQRVAISEKNNTQDAYSAIAGSEVDKIPYTNIEQWFSSKEAKTIEVTIPKLVNTSPLFRDELYRDILKNTFIASVNEKNLKESTKYYKIVYDGAEIATFTNGTLTSSYVEEDIKQLEALLADNPELLAEKTADDKDKEITFTKFEEDTPPKYSPDGLEIKLTGTFKSGGVFGVGSKTYHLDAMFYYDDNRWKLDEESLEVTNAD